MTFTNQPTEIRNLLAQPRQPRPLIRACRESISNHIGNAGSAANRQQRRRLQDRPLDGDGFEQPRKRLGGSQSDIPVLARIPTTFRHLGMALLDTVAVRQRRETEDRACAHGGLGLPRDSLQKWREVEGTQGPVGGDFSHLTQRSR